MISRLWICCVAVAFVTVSCHVRDDKPPPLFRLMDAAETGVGFSNDIVQTESFSIIDYMYFFNGGGVGVGDINNDGLPDLYFTGNLVSSRLYLNKGNFQFEDITEKAGVTTNGWCTGVAFADVDADGFTDIYVSRAGSTKGIERSNLFFLNNKDNTFTEIARQSGIADSSYTTQSAFFDYDRDGDLDLYVLNHDHAPKVVNNPVPIRTNGQAKNTDKLYRNTGNDQHGRPHFEDVSRAANILTEGFGLGVAIHDINNDGWPDVYVANDFMSPDILYINNRDGTFTNRAPAFLKHQSYNGMGVDIADYNNDGLQDIMVMDMLPEDNFRQKMMLGGMTNEKFEYLLSMNYPPQYMRNTLQLNRGGNHFSEIAQVAGVDRTDWSWSPLFADFDNDGWKDLFITNGYFKDITDRDFIMFTNNKTMFKKPKEMNKILLELMEKQPGVKLPNVVFRNNGDLTFAQQKNWGVDQTSFSNGAAYADLDNDGDLDMIVNNINDRAFIYKNEVRHDSAHYLQILLKGEGGNKMALGAQLTLYAGKNIQFYEHTLYRGYESTVDNVIHFGLGKNTAVDSVEIRWPDGRRSVVVAVKADQRMIIPHDDAKFSEAAAATKVLPFLTDITKQSGVRFLPIGSQYSDLTAHPLLPQSYAALGPSLAAGDVDDNGLDDFYIGSSTGSPGKIMLQTAPGRFHESDFKTNRLSADAGSLMFDADNDGDLDLYVAEGINDAPAQPIGHALFVNDGKGKFTADMTALPSLPASASVVTAADFDRDGDLDLFVGGRMHHDYPLAPASHILINDHGKFRDATSEICNELKTVGMISTAIWTDFDNDSQLDLIVAGEWTPVMFFKNINGKLVNVTSATELGNTTGWWNSIVGGDVDNDGDTDYVLGNVGYNIPFRDGDKKSVSLYYGDLDGTSTHHAMLAWQYNGVDFPWTPKDILYKLMPRYSKRMLKYSEYAHASMDDLLGPVSRDNIKVIRAERLGSCYLENRGAGRFFLKPLPMEAQFAPVYGTVLNDIDGDGNLDLILTGNQQDADVSIGRYDASFGLVLKGNGKGGFIPVEQKRSGFLVEKDRRALISLDAGGGNNFILSASSVDSLRIFNFTTETSPVKVRPLDNVVFVENKISKTRKKIELYYGSGYLSQSSRVPQFFPATETAEIVDSRGNIRRYSHQQ